MTKFVVEKKVEGENGWFYEGTWNEPKHLAYSMFELGRNAGAITDIRIRVEEANDDGA